MVFIEVTNAERDCRELLRVSQIVSIRAMKRGGAVVGLLNGTEVVTGESMDWMLSKLVKIAESDLK